MSVTCPKLCKECPFSNTSLKGYLATYEPEDFVRMMSLEKTFVCHMMMDKSLSWDEATALVEAGEMKLCRGYVESLIKSCHMPKFNSLLTKAIAEVKEQGLSENSMMKWDFVKYHKEK